MAGRKGGEAVSRDRAHMAAIGREGGHSRGARARAGSIGAAPAGGAIGAPTGTAPGNRDRDRNDEPFVRQSNDERSGFGASRSFGSQERPGTAREERGDTSNEGGPLSSRDRI